MSKTVSDSTDASWANTPAIGYSREDDLAFPTSFAQDRLFFLHQLEVGLAAYNIPVAFRLRGRLAVRALEESLAEILRRHDVLRTVFLLRDGRPVQVVGPARPTAVPEVDLRGVPEAERDAEAVRLATVEAETSFDLSRGPLLRAKRLRLSEDEHLLVVTMHHVVSDGWSMDLFLRELASLYEAFSRGKPSPLAELPIQYADYAVWQRDWLQGEALEVELSYWKQQLAGAPGILELPTDRRRPPLQSFRGASDSIVLPPLLADGLRSLSGREGTTLFMTLLAAFYTLLFRYTGEEDILVGSPIAGRSRVETEGLIGFFVNTLVLRGDLSGNPTFRQLLARVKEVALSAYSHQDIPFERLVEELRPKRSLAHSPLFQVMFQLRTDSEKGIELAGLEVEELRLPYRVAKFDLSLAVVAGARRTTCFFEYNTDIFDATTIRRCMSHFEVLLRGILEDPDRSVSDLPLLTKPERQRLLVEWNDTARPYPRDSSIHRAFEAQSAQAPGSIAVRFRQRELTYGDLNARANRLARLLRSVGVREGARVGLCAERSLEMPVALLAILKAGGAYVPLDPSYPPDRLAFMIGDAKTELLLAQRALSRSLPGGAGRVIWIDEEGSFSGQPADDLPGDSCPQATAYIMYTSGSTGIPKGVAVAHRGVLRLVFGAEYAQLSAAETFLQLAPVSFDASTLEIWGPLLHGAPCVLFPQRQLTPSELGAILKAEKVTILWLTASLFNEVVDADPSVLSSVRQLLIGGEALSVDHVRRASKSLPNTRIVNGYGPTENTTFTCTYPIPRPLSRELSSIPIGRAISNTRVYVLDRHGTPVPIGVPGELYVGGDGLADGYVDRPELTAASFVPDSFAASPGGRLYRTGDLARCLPDGNIVFLGRLDRQVKVRGFRVEPGEVEAVLVEHPSVKECAVVWREESPGEGRLVAYVVFGGEEAATEDLRRHLKGKLPDHMVPSAFVALPSLPRSPSGKIDRRGLPAPEPGRGESMGGYVAPRDALERQLVKIWEAVLRVQPIGVRDDFFELGGHSLLAVKLFTQIEKRVGRRLPLATLFEAPSVEKLAALLRQEGWKAPWSSLVAIQPGGSKPPFYCMHAFGGNVLTYRDLARHLGPDQPVYGLQATGLDGERTSFARIEDMAAHYVKEIRNVQPEGPYHLGGSSFGGMVAFEIAQQLHAQGQDVGVLALFDTYGPGYGRLLPNMSRLRRKIYRLLERIDLHVGNFLVAERGEKLTYILTKSRRLKATLLQRWGKARQRLLPRFLRQVHNASRQAHEAYVPKVYPGKVTLFRAEGQPAGIYPDPMMGWSCLALGGLEIHEVPGRHGAIVYEPRASRLAEQLKACLEARNTQKEKQSPVGAGGTGIPSSRAVAASLLSALDPPSGPEGGTARP